MEMSQASLEMLNEAIKNGIIDIDDVQHKMEQKRRNELLASHPYKIFQLGDGRWRTRIKDETKKDGRRSITKKTREELEEAIIASMTEEEDALANISIVGLFDEWIDYKALEVDYATISRIRSDFNTFYLNDELMNKPIVDLTKLDLDIWCKKRIREFKMTKTKYYNCTLILRQELKYAVARGILSENLFEGVGENYSKLFYKPPKKDSSSQVFTDFEREELKKLAWQDFHDSVKFYQLAPLGVMFMFLTGVRIGELVVLRYEDIVRDRYIHVQRMYCRDEKTVVEHTKTEAGDREVYLTDEALGIIAAAKQRQIELGVESDGYIFSINGQPLGYAATQALFRKYCRKIGTVQKSSHKARKTFITNLVNSPEGISINSIREMVGHEDERTTLHNYTFDTNEVSERNEKIERALCTDPKIGPKNWTHLGPVGPKNCST